MTFNEFEYPNKLDKIFEKLDKFNLIPIIVGGYVRDFFLNKESKDIDIEVYGLDNISQLSPILKEFGKVYEVGKSFGVCKLQLDELELDFSMPRIDKKTSNGHKGFEVTTKKELDYKTAASRRDFTINSIGYDTINKTIIDPFSGLNDIAIKTLKVVDKKSFIEDPLRVFRAISMCARFELEVESYTTNLCKQMIEQNMLNELPKERVYEELKKLFLKSKRPSIGFEFLKKIGGLCYFDELNISDKLWLESMQSIDRFKANNDVYNIEDNKTNIKLLLVLISYHLEDKKIFSFIAKLTNEKNIADEIIEIIKNSKSLLKETSTYTLRKIATKVKLYEVFKILDALGLDISQNYDKAIKLDIIDKPVPKLLHGKDLISIGLKPSPLFNKILDEAYENQLHSKFDNKEDALSWLKNYLSKYRKN